MSASKGMKFGIWVEIENLGVDSAMFQAHPDWCLTYNGNPVHGMRSLSSQFRQT